MPDEALSRLDSRPFKGGLVFRDFHCKKMNRVGAELLPALARLGFFGLLLLSASAAAARVPTVVLLPAPGSAGLDSPSLLLLEEALRGRGATVLSSQSFLLAAEELEISAADLTRPESIQRLAMSIGANGVLFVSPTAAPPLWPLRSEGQESSPPLDSKTPGSGTPGSQAPDSGTPDSETPASRTRDSETPDSRTPDSQTPGSTTPGSTTPGSTTPGAQAPDSGTPDSQIPDSSQSPETRNSEPSAHPPRKPQRQGLRLQVFDERGEKLWDGEVALASGQLSRSEASALASFAVSAVDENLKAQEGRGGGEQEKSPLDIADEVIRPAPSSLALARLGAEVNFSYRQVRLDENLRQGSDLDADSLAFGAGLRFDSYPLPLSWGGRFLGIGVDYSYANHQLRVPGTGGSINLPVSDHRVVADLIGRFELGLKNRLLLRGGFAYSAFVVEDDGFTGSVDHMSGRLALEYERKLPAELEIWLRAGVRPLSRVGMDLPQLYAGKPSSVGWDARLTLSGPLDGLIPLLRWTLGYEHLGYADRFSSNNGVMTREELYHRIFVGMIWAKD